MNEENFQVMTLDMPSSRSELASGLSRTQSYKSRGRAEKMSESDSIFGPTPRTDRDGEGQKVLGRQENFFMVTKEFTQDSGEMHRKAVLLKCKEPGRLSLLSDIHSGLHRGETSSSIHSKAISRRASLQSVSSFSSSWAGDLTDDIQTLDDLNELDELNHDENTEEDEMYQPFPEFRLAQVCYDIETLMQEPWECASSTPVSSGTTSIHASPVVSRSSSPTYSTSFVDTNLVDSIICTSREKRDSRDSDLSQEEKEKSPIQILSVEEQDIKNEGEEEEDEEEDESKGQSSRKSRKESTIGALPMSKPLSFSRSHPKSRSRDRRKSKRRTNWRRQIRQGSGPNSFLCSHTALICSEYHTIGNRDTMEDRSFITSDLLRFFFFLNI